MVGFGGGAAAICIDEGVRLLNFNVVSACLAFYQHYRVSRCEDPPGCGDLQRGQ